MMIDKEQVLDLLRQQGDEGTAHQAERDLPEQIDTENDGGLLQKYGINVEDLIAGSGGGSGGLGGQLT